MKNIIVLNDGETWSELPGCKIMRITDYIHQKLVDGDITVDDIDDPMLRIQSADEMKNLFFVE